MTLRVPVHVRNRGRECHALYAPYKRNQFGRHSGTNTQTHTLDWSRYRIVSACCIWQTYYISGARSMPPIKNKQKLLAMGNQAIPCIESIRLGKRNRQTTKQTTTATE